MKQELNTFSSTESNLFNIDEKYASIMAQFGDNYTIDECSSYSAPKNIEDPLVEVHVGNGHTMIVPMSHVKYMSDMGQLPSSASIKLNL